jgi:hypothetical protein
MLGWSRAEPGARIFRLRKRFGNDCHLAGSWKLEAGSWNLESGSWKLEAGSWKPEAGSWKLEAGSWKPSLSVRMLPWLAFSLNAARWTRS